MTNRPAIDETKVTIRWDIDGIAHEAEVPEMVSPFFDVLGVELAVSLLLEWGGTPLYLPRPDSILRQGGDLVDLVGADKARQLGGAIGAGHIKIPICREFLCRYFHSKGFSKLKIARKLKVSDETVRRILNGRRTSELRRLYAHRRGKAAAA
ncbi:hypothetical protein AB4Z13_15445 [Rhizobium sp. YAF28]|uniref:hypothetical protein n=1 Tax=Rhizobium sp. YAF28 TaxID=3233081 RepID=UPI003F998966